MSIPLFLKKIATRLRQSGKNGTGRFSSGSMERGVLIFGNTSEVIAAERVLKKAGFPVEVKGPPPTLQTGCDLVLTFPLVKRARVETLLKEADLIPEKIAPETCEFLEPVSLYEVKDLGAWLMIRAANMKVTINKNTGIIVNVSGGGCPDVPWLAQKMVGLTLDAAPEPLLAGQTLCAYCLQKAFEEAKKICARG